MKKKKKGAGKKKRRARKKVISLVGQGIGETISKVASQGITGPSKAAIRLESKFLPMNYTVHGKRLTAQGVTTGAASTVFPLGREP